MRLSSTQRARRLCRNAVENETLDFVIICQNHQNAFIQSISLGSAHPKSHISSLNFDQNFISFLMPHSGPHFLRFWCDLAAKSSIFLAPWRQAGPKMAPKIAQVAPKWHHFHLYALAFLQTCFRDRFWSAPGHHFFGLLIDFDPLFKDFCRFLTRF